MKYLKTLGLAAVAATAFMALVGVGSASAHSTALCKANELPCAAGNVIASGTSITSQLKTGTTATLLSSLGNVVCKKSGVSGKTTSGLGLSVTGNITSVTFTECTRGGENCTVTSPASSTNPFAASILVIPGTMNGEFTVTKPRATVKCGIFINCTFGFESVNLEAVGGNPATVLASEVLLTFEEGGICPGESHWDAEYEVTAPNPLYVAE